LNWRYSLVRSNDLVIPAVGWGRFATAGLTVTLALLVGLAGATAWGQPLQPGAQGATESGESGRPEVAVPDIPVDDMDRGTPRRAVQGFLQATRTHDFQRAARYLDLRDVPAREARIRGPQLARQLKIVLDQTLQLDVDALTDTPDGHLHDGLPSDVEHVGRIDTPRGPVHIRLQQVLREDGIHIWKISAATVSMIPWLYGIYADHLLGELLPGEVFDAEFLDTQLRQWVALPVIVGLGYALAVLVTALGLRLVRRRHIELASMLGRFVVGPARLTLTVLLLAIVRRPLLLSVRVDRMLTVLEQILLIIAVAWMALRVAGSFEEVARHRLLKRRKLTLLPLLPVARRTAQILMTMLAGVAVLHSFGVNVVTVLAGLGVGGIAVALAAQKTLENFIGGITLYADQPVRVGDFCRFGGTVGTVEEVGLRSTRVRTLDRTVVTIPNAEFSNLQIENFARRERIWFHPTISLRYGTSPDQVRYVLVEVRRMLYAHPRVDSGSARIRFAGFGSSSLDLEVFSYVNESDYGAYLEVAEDLNLRIMDIVAAAGSSFALPSQTTYIEPGQGLDRDRARAAEVQVKEWRERHELCLPSFPQEKISEIENTLDYPPDGSATLAGGGQ
jgi:MscS family membrane protein